jgi:GGDEF domain-containing protein
LLMIDADHFKKVNDTHGHHAGDSALKAIAHTLALSLRPKDLVGRWGGEEFLVILADVDGSTLFPLAERSRKLIAASSVPVPGARSRSRSRSARPCSAATIRRLPSSNGPMPVLMPVKLPAGIKPRWDKRRECDVRLWPGGRPLLVSNTPRP